MFDLNWVAVVVATVSSMVIGFLWYSPSLFGRQWEKLSGTKMGGSQKGTSQLYLLTTLAAFVLAWAVANLIKMMGVTTLGGGVQAGAILWLGFVASTSLPHYLFSGKPANLYFIDSGFHLVEMAVMGAILASMG